MVGGGGQHEGYATLDYRKIHQGNAGKLSNYPILSVLPDKFARFLFEYHSHRFESLDLPQWPADRSDFDVHGALLDEVYALAPCLIGNLKAGPSQGQLSPSQVMPNNRPEAGLEKFNSINTIANTGETVISGRRKSRKSAGPTRKTGLTRKEGTSCSPCWRDTTLLTIPSLDCSSVWLLILMLLLFSLCFSLPYGISHSTTTRYLLASCFSLLHNNIRPSKNLLEREGLAVDLSSIIFRAKMITSWFVSKTLVALGLFAGCNLCLSSSFPLGDSSWDCQLPVQVGLLGLVIFFSGLISPSNY
jgi:hypothetical protein